MKAFSMLSALSVLMFSVHSLAAIVTETKTVSGDEKWKGPYNIEVIQIVPSGSSHSLSRAQASINAQIMSKSLSAICDLYELRGAAENIHANVKAKAFLKNSYTLVVQEANDRDCGGLATDQKVKTSYYNLITGAEVDGVNGQPLPPPQQDDVWEP